MVLFCVVAWFGLLTAAIAATGWSLTPPWLRTLSRRGTSPAPLRLTRRTPPSSRSSATYSATTTTAPHGHRAIA